MSWQIKDKQSARKATAAAQAAAVVLVVSGAAMAMLGPSWLELSAPEAPPPLTAPETAASRDGGGVSEPVDAITVSEYFGMIRNVPVPDAEATVVVESDPGEAEATPAREIRFIGSARAGDRVSAFMKIAGVTKLLRQGDVYEGVELVAVEGDRVVISIDGGEAEELVKSARTGSGVTMVVGGAAPPPAAVSATGGDAPVAPSFTPDMSREERRAMLLERARDERQRWERNRGEGGGGPPDRNQR